MNKVWSFPDRVRQVVSVHDIRILSITMLTHTTSCDTYISVLGYLISSEIGYSGLLAQVVSGVPRHH